MTEKTNLPAVITGSTEAMAAEREAINWEQVAKAYVIDSPEMAEAAAEDLKAIKEKAKELDGLRTRLKKPSLDEGRAIDKHFKKPLDFLASAEGVLKGAILTFQQAEQAKLAEQQRLLQIEQDRLQREADAEQQARVEAARAAGNHDEAEALQQELVYVPAVAQVEQTKLAGISTRASWKGRVVDKLALVKAVAEGRADLALLEVNQAVLDGLAKALKGGLSVPGCEPYEDKTLSVRV